jgi:hypothetical protein
MSVFMRYCQGDTKISYFYSTDMAIPCHFVNCHCSVVLIKLIILFIWVQAKKKPLNKIRGFSYLIYKFYTIKILCVLKHIIILFIFNFLFVIF